MPGVSAGVNYGTGKVRFPSPGARWAAACAAAPRSPPSTRSTGGVQTTITITIQVEGQDKPACVIESLSRWLGS